MSARSHAAVVAEVGALSARRRTAWICYTSTAGRGRSQASGRSLPAVVFQVVPIATRHSAGIDPTSYRRVLNAPEIPFFGLSTVFKNIYGILEHSFPISAIMYNETENVIIECKNSTTQNSVFHILLHIQ
jgi:hypothetical protein